MKIVTNIESQNKIILLHESQKHTVVTFLNEPESEWMIQWLIY